MTVQTINPGQTLRLLSADAQRMWLDLYRAVLARPHGGQASMVDVRLAAHRADQAFMEAASRIMEPGETGENDWEIVDPPDMEGDGHA